MKLHDSIKAATGPTQRSSGTESFEATIRRHPFLEGMSPHQYRILMDCAMPAAFKAGEVVFHEGEPANRFYLIEAGKVALESRTDTGVMHIQTIEAGDVLGWSWLFPPYFWRFDARAVDPTEAIFFYAAPLRNECEIDHDLGYELTNRMARVAVRRLQATRWKLLDRQA
jgi:CRP-like cAMP-binding protein